MKTILPICKTPLIKEVNTSAYIYGLLKIQENFSNTWLINNCINIRYSSKFGGCLTYKIPINWFIKYFKPSIVISLSDDNINKKIKRNIQKGKYVIIWVNTKYLSGLKDKRNRNHDLMIFGFNDKEYYTISYFDEYYTEKTFTINELIMARKKTNKFKLFFYALEPKKSYNYRKINKKHVKRLINKHLNTHQKSLGINAYKVLQNEIIYYAEQLGTLDIRSFCFMRERPVVFKSFSEHFFLDQSIKELIEENIEIGEKTINLSLLYNAKKDKIITDKIICLIDKYVSNEIILCKRIKSLL